MTTYTDAYLVTEPGMTPLSPWQWLSKQLNARADEIVKEMSKLSGPAFDRYYAKNELRYHKAVNDLIEKAFIPNIENAEVKALFEEAVVIFKAHEKHAEMMVAALED